MLVVTAGLLASALTARPARAQERGVRATQPQPSDSASSYHALVVGNDNYASLPKLKTAAADAREVERVLRETYGFRTRLLVNATRAQIVAALSAYRRELDSNANLLIYYAGHGYNDRDADKAYWLPVDATPDDVSNWIIADEITTGIRVTPARHVLVVSDSCYSGMLTRGIGVSPSSPAEREQFLQRMSAGHSRTLMASGGDEPVADGGGGGHSVFAAALLRGLRQMDKPRYTASELFNNYIIEPVAGRADQTPVYNPLRNSGHESGDFVFTKVNSGDKTADAVADAPPARVDPEQRELAFWNSIQSSTDAEDFKDYLARYPEGLYAGIARRRVTALSAEKSFVSESKPAPTSTPTGTPSVTKSEPERTSACSSDVDTKAALYSDFLQRYKSSPDQQKAAYETGSEYLSNFGGCADENDRKVAAFIQSWVGKYEAAVVNFNCVDAFNKRDYSKAFRECGSILSRRPDDVGTALLLARAGYANASLSEPNKSLNADAARAARRAVELIQSGKTPAQWEPFPSREEALGFLHYAQGIFMLEGSPSDAAAEFIKAAQSDSRFAREHSTYTYLASIYEANELNPLVDRYNATFPPGESVPAARASQYNAMLAQLGKVQDRIIDALARAASILESDAGANANTKATVMSRLNTYYAERHGGKTDGLRELVSRVMSRRLMFNGNEFK